MRLRAFSVRRGIRRALPVLVGLATIGALCASLVFVPETFGRLQLFVFDSLQRAAPRPVADLPVRVVDIDEESLARYGQWPWSRSTVATLIRNLQDMGAAAIALDIVFAEPDRTSPARLASEFESQGLLPVGASKAAFADQDDDLAKAISRGRVVMGFGLLPTANGRPVEIKSSFATIGGDPAETVPNFGGAVPNLPVLQDAAAGQGSFTIAAGRDEIVRRLPLISALNGKLIPSLAAEALRVAQGEETIRIRAERGGDASAGLTGYTMRIGTFDVPLTADGALWLHHTAPNPQRTISAARILDPENQAARDVIGNAIVFIGTSAVGLADLRPTPLSPFEPGVNIHAGAAEQVITSHYLARPAWATGAEALVAVCGALLLLLLLAQKRIRLAAATTAGLTVTAFAATWIGFRSHGVLFDPSFIVIALWTTFVTASAVWYFGLERDASRLRSAFAQYLSPVLVEQLAADPDQLQLGGELREMTFLFTDLEGFTRFAETAQPQVLVSVINDYLDGLCGIAVDHGGTIDKIVGDALHVMFNAPIDQPDHRERAVRCALAIDAFAREFSLSQNRQGVAFGATRIGVNTGNAVVGNFGGKRRFDYTAHGDAINTAARLEAANKTLGTRICVARASADPVEGVRFRPVGMLMLKGKEIGVQVFEPILSGSPAASWADIYADIFARLADGDDTAAAALLELHAAHPNDPILSFHARRISAGERSTRMAA